MSNRMLGILCMIGGVVMTIAGFTVGSFANTPGIIAGIVWAIGGIAGLVGLIQLGALGESAVTRALGFVPIIGFLSLAIGSVMQLAGMVGDDSVLFGIGWGLQLVGMVLVAVLVIAAKRWRGWRRFTPLLTIVTVPVAFGLGQALGDEYLGLTATLVYIAWILLGYAVATAEPAPAAERAAAV